MAYSVAKCNSEIIGIEGKIKEYKAAKDEIKTAKSTCKTDAKAYATTIKKIKGDLLKMEKKGCFEGKMATKLGTIVSDFKSDLESAKSKADELATAADKQIAKIDLKIADLNTDERTWRGNLQVAINAEVANQKGRKKK